MSSKALQGKNKNAKNDPDKGLPYTPAENVAGGPIEGDGEQGLNPGMEVKGTSTAAKVVKGKGGPKR